MNDYYSIITRCAIEHLLYALELTITEDSKIRATYQLDYCIEDINKMKKILKRRKKNEPYYYEING